LFYFFCFLFFYFSWDRTSQLTSLSELFLDPFYRTIIGFEVLIEKEWLSFGHKFGQRTGIDIGEKKKNSEKSPVFFQFIECVANVITQFPTSFEFNHTFLFFLYIFIFLFIFFIFIFYSLLPSCRFGTFLCNNQKQREDLQLSLRTISIWTFMNSNISKYVNPIYQLNQEVIRPSVNMRDIYFWQEFYFRW
jgi:myotubularin-related protein 1/2